MKDRIISYKDLSPTFSIQFCELNEKLFPELKISVPNTKGIVTIREKGFFRKVRTKKHINTFLLQDLITSIAFAKYGSESMVDLYRTKLLEILKHDTSALNNLSKVVDLLYSEFFNTAPLEVKTVLTVIHHKITPVENNILEDQEHGTGATCSLFDFIRLRSRKRFIVTKRNIIAATVALLFYAQISVQKSFVDTGQDLLYNLCMRAPPSTELFFNNST